MKRWVCVVGLILLLSVIAVGFAITFLPNPAIARARDESVRLLSESADAPAMEHAVGYLGIIFHFADGSWIAIRYVDCHAHPIWSSGVALDSKGRWYESEVHFCGQFKIYRGQWDRTLEILQNPQATREEKKSWVEDCPLEPERLRHLEESPDLETAREHLLKLGFNELNNQTVPKMSGPWPERVETKAAIVKQLLR